MRKNDRRFGWSGVVVAVVVATTVVYWRATGSRTTPTTAIDSRTGEDRSARETGRVSSAPRIVGQAPSREEPDDRDSPVPALIPLPPDGAGDETLPNNPADIDRSRILPIPLEARGDAEDPPPTSRLDDVATDDRAANAVGGASLEIDVAPEGDNTLRTGSPLPDSENTAAPSFARPAVETPPDTTPSDTTPSDTTPSEAAEPEGAADSPAPTGPGDASVRSTEPDQGHPASDDEALPAAGQDESVRESNEDAGGTTSNPPVPTDSSTTSSEPDGSPSVSTEPGVVASEASPSDVEPSKRGAERRVRQYVVRPGDTLFGIALRELGEAKRWTELYRLNRDRVGQDFAALPAGLKLLIPLPPVEQSETARRE